MNTRMYPVQAAARPRAALLMVLCGILGIGAGAAGAATTEDAVPKITVKYDPRSLASDSGARAVYRRLVMAAAEVCPEYISGSRIPSGATLECRRQAVARAVHQINDPRLAAVGAALVKTG